MVLIASGFQSVLLCPSLMTVHVQRESITLTQGIRTIKTLIKNVKEMQLLNLPQNLRSDV